MNRMPINAGADYNVSADNRWGDLDRKTPPRRYAQAGAPRVYDNPGYTRTRGRAPRAAKRSRFETSRLSRALMYAAMAVLMTGLILQVGRLAQIASSAKQISALTAEIKELRGEKENLEVRLTMKQNLNRIHDEAVYKCEMSYPEDGQIRVVSLLGSGSESLTRTASTNGGASEAD